MGGPYRDKDKERAYHKAYNERNREKRKAYAKSYREKHKERLRQNDRKYAAAHREEARERAAAWYEANKERGRETRKKWYMNNRERMSEYNKERRAKNSEKIKEYDRKRSTQQHRKDAHRRWRIANSAKIVARVKEWAANNKVRVRITRKGVSGRRRARLNSRPTEAFSAADVWAEHGGICGLCGLPVSFDEFVLDHIIPIAHGGAHVYANVHPAHHECNRRKGARVDWPIIHSL